MQMRKTALVGECALSITVIYKTVEAAASDVKARETKKKKGDTILVFL